jgi:hypothetical protein
MPYIISTSNPIARKTHSCGACQALGELGLEPGLLTFSELRAFAKAKAKDFKILLGERYHSATIQDGDRLYTFRAIPAIDWICHRLNVYDD